jgi:hypothetical protein
MPQETSFNDKLDSTSGMPLRHSVRADASRELVLSGSRGAVFDHAIDLLKSNLLPLLLIVSIVLLPIILSEHYVVSSLLNPKLVALNVQQGANSAFQSFEQRFALAIEYIPTGLPRYGVPGCLLFIAALFASAPVSLAVTDIVAGRRVSVINSLRTTWLCRMNVISCILLTSLCCFAIWGFATIVVGAVGFIPWMALVFASSRFPSPAVAGWITIFYFFACILVPVAVTCLFFGRTFALSIPVCVNERASTMACIARSQQLAMCDRYGATVLTFTMLPIMVLAVQFMLIFGCNSALQLLNLSPMWGYIASIAITSIIVCIINCYWMVYTTVLYYDHRVKHECFDIRMLMVLDSAK